MSPANNLVYLVQHLAATISKQTDQLLQEQLGIGLSQFKILMLLEWNPRVQQQTIAHGLGQTESSISRQIKLLEHKRLVSAQPDPRNKRKHITAPTPLGMQVTEAATAMIRRSLRSDYAGLDEDQLSQLLGNLQQLHRVVCQPGKQGACDHLLGF